MQWIAKAYFDDAVYERSDMAWEQTEKKFRRRRV
jgi:hypothetical protein